MHHKHHERHEHPQVLSASTLSGDKVTNPEGENLGEIKELMIDLDSGRVAYAVLSFGGFLGMGDKFFAIPWEALRLSTEEHKFYLDVPKDRLKEAPGFDKDHWPGTADREFQNKIYSYYGYKPYWETATGTTTGSESFRSSSGGGGVSDTDMDRSRNR